MPEGQMVRTKDDRMIAGVCGGLARWLGWDATAVRVPARSWVWNRDVWIGPPAPELLSAGSPSASRNPHPDSRQRATFTRSSPMSCAN